MHLELLAGIAADNVAKVQLLTSDGHVVTTVPAIRNVCSLAHVPKNVVGLRVLPQQGSSYTALPQRQAAVVEAVERGEAGGSAARERGRRLTGRPVTRELANAAQPSG